MNNNLFFLKNSPLFDSIKEEEIKIIINYLEAFEKVFEENEIIINLNEKIRYAAIVKKGKANVTMLNFSSNEYLLEKLTMGDLFLIGQSFNIENHSIVEVRAQEKCQIMFLNLSKLERNEIHDNINISQLFINLFKIISAQSIIQNHRIHILIQIHIRHKIVLYLSKKYKSNPMIEVPLNRQEFANHLNVDRSALSRELGRLKKEGYIDFHKNQIIIKNNSILQLSSIPC